MIALKVFQIEHYGQLMQSMMVTQPVLSVAWDYVWVWSTVSFDLRLTVMTTNDTRKSGSDVWLVIFGVAEQLNPAIAWPFQH